MFCLASASRPFDFEDQGFIWSVRRYLWVPRPPFRPYFLCFRGSGPSFSSSFLVLCICIFRLLLLILLFLFLVLIHGAWPTGPRRSECARSAHDDLVLYIIRLMREGALPWDPGVPGSRLYSAPEYSMHRGIYIYIYVFVKILL